MSDELDGLASSLRDELGLCECGKCGYATTIHLSLDKAVALESARVTKIIESQIARYEAEAKEHLANKNERAASQMLSESHALSVALYQVRQ